MRKDGPKARHTASMKSGRLAFSPLLVRIKVKSFFDFGWIEATREFRQQYF